jgi:hypothetical protein
VDELCIDALLAKKAVILGDKERDFPFAEAAEGKDRGASGGCLWLSGGQADEAD